jgi:hypothetical protein
MPTSCSDSHQNARAYAAGKPDLERIIELLIYKPAYPAELRRLARLSPRDWNILWDELKDSGLLAKEPTQRRWRLRSDREAIDCWKRRADKFSMGELSPRVYARCPDVPKSNQTWLWERLSRSHWYWNTPVECPFCGHGFASPCSDFWRRGLRIQAECRHLLFVGREGDGWVYQAPRLRRFMQSTDRFVTHELIDLAALNSVGGQACRLA